MGKLFSMALLAAFPTSSRAVPEQAAKLEFFESKIRPMFVKHCYECHSAESGKTKGGLLLDSRAGWQVGGESGPAIIPGKPDESLLIKAINRSGLTPEMPPKTNLSSRVINDFRQWIADGAVDPREGEALANEKETIDIEEGRKFWSFQPRRKFSSNRSIDDFVKPQAPRASADKLVRRLFLDLIGLPPTPEECREFLRLHEEQSPEKAVDSLLEDLLSRKEFGEKWARHWLDVVRYADSNGGDFNLTFTESWRYRNYVIDAFNDDKPYDQFLTEQLAGDELFPWKTDEPLTTKQIDSLVATGFLRTASDATDEGSFNKIINRFGVINEQLEIVTSSVMGLTLECARCHSHKFDPIPQSDYYAMAGIFFALAVLVVGRVGELIQLQMAVG